MSQVLPMQQGTVVQEKNRLQNVVDYLPEKRKHEPTETINTLGFHIVVSAMKEKIKTRSHVPLTL